MEVHSDDGTHRLELPVSRTTLKLWGGVPREISEKSDKLVWMISARQGGNLMEGAYTERSGSCQPGHRDQQWA